MRVVFDIETETIPLLVSDINKVFCIGLKVDDEPVKCYTYLYTPYSDGNLQAAINILKKADVIIGHNIAKFDLPILEKLFGEINTPFVDTLIDAKLSYSKDELIAIDTSIPTYPSKLIGSYSLKAFGYRFNDLKLEYDEFSNLNERMIEYCKQDVELTAKLYDFLIKHPRYPNKEVRELEYRVASITYKQEQFGFYFDIDNARKLATKLKFRAMDIERKLKSIFKPIFEADGDVIKPAKVRNEKVIVKKVLPKLFNLMPFVIPLKISKKGEYKQLAKSFKFKEYPFRIVNRQINGEYQKIKLSVLNPKSRQQLVTRLMKQFNWKPKNYTEKANIRLEFE